ncbi:MAG: hypothetical protein DME63_02625 [Verrucomicrobia bacterium]|nr:MAG: hypothetical protein DME63_02625 [Verrucomicrobiota bacterium]
MHSKLPRSIERTARCLKLHRRQMKEDDFQYAIENTQVILAPEQKIATFGTTSFRFYLISELMDRVNEVRVRDGKIHADRPQILTPEHFSRLLLEGFGMFRDPIESVIARTKSHVQHRDEPLSAIIQGVDEAWEVCLLKFTIDMIERSSGGNIGDFRKRGLI